MALLITEDCIACDACLGECPHTAIEEGNIIYKIEVESCTECIGIYSEPACICACPIDCIIPDKDNAESVEELKLKRSRLEARDE